MSQALAFDATAHRYALDGRALPSVTQVLVAAGLVDLAWATEDARQRGSYVHEAIALGAALDREALDPALALYVAGWDAFLRDTGADEDPGADGRTLMAKTKTTIVDGWELLGTIGNDSGLMMLVDPCYVIGGRGDMADVFGEDWGAFQKKLTTHEKRGVQFMLFTRQFPALNLPDGRTIPPPPPQGMAAVVATGGDGQWNVWVMRDKAQRVVAWKVVSA